MKRSISKEELERKKSAGAVVFHKRKRKPEPDPEVNAPPLRRSPPPDNKSSEVIAAAERAIAATDELRRHDQTLADKIAEAVNQRSAPISYECTITKRDSKGRLASFRLDPV